MHRTHTARIVKRAPRWSALGLALLSAVLAFGVGSSAIAQDATPTGAAAGKSDPVAKPPRKVRGRLPAYYSRVVSQEQRTEIYGIQARFAEQMKKLQEQLAALEETRDKEVSGVLTADQQKQVEAMAAAARAKRAAKAAGDPPPPPAGRPATGDGA